MKKYSLSYRQYGQNALIISWPDVIDEEVLFDIIRFSNHLKKLPDFKSGWDMVIAYRTLTLIQNFKEFDYTKLKDGLTTWYDELDHSTTFKRYLWKLPVCYDEDFGIDLVELESTLGLSRNEIIKLHTQGIYTIYGIGFLPGFMYLGGLAKELETPRRATPRLNVLKGSVGLAGKQTGIYPQDSPGGWNIIGNCPIPLFKPNRETPCIVSVGDRVQFIEVERAEYEVHKIEAEVDIYNIEKIKIDA